jgi:hypothetical protein
VDGEEGNCAVMSSEPIYEQRYCAYVDILGFRELINNLGTKKRNFEAVRDLLRTIHTPQALIAGDLEEVDFRAQSISDAVALSTRKNRLGLPSTGIQSFLRTVRGIGRITAAGVE